MYVSNIDNKVEDKLKYCLACQANHDDTNMQLLIMRSTTADNVTLIFNSKAIVRIFRIMKYKTSTHKTILAIGKWRS